MLDAGKVKLTKLGTMVIKDGDMSIEGFEAEGGTCREVAVLAAVWAIGELQKELIASLESPGGNMCVN